MRMIDEIIRQASANEYNIPIFGYDEWQDLKAQFKTEGELHDGVDTILPAIQRWIANEKPALPIVRPTVEEMEKCFNSLLNMKWKNSVRTVELDTVRNKFDEQVDISHVVSCGHNFNSVSNHFQCDNRYTCGHATAESSQWAWDNPFSSRTRSMLLYLWREFKDEPSPIDEDKYRCMFRLSGYVATQFKPAVAKTIYEMESAKKVIDISCGWGDRLAGFYTSSRTEEYLGCDPNKESYEIYKKQCIAYEELLQSPLFPEEVVFEDHGDWFEVKGHKRVRIYNRPAEDIDWDTVCETKHDLMFTSPPYFGIEKYAEGSDCEDMQSWKRYDEYDTWRDTFFYPVMDAMQRNCHKVMINIVDPLVKGKRNYIEKDIRARYGIADIVGMPIAKRPLSDDNTTNYSVDTDEGEKRVTFIEPIYVLDKP